VKNDRKYALFLGCTILLRGRQYELAAVEIAGRFGIDLAPLRDFACWGFPIKSASRDGKLHPAYYTQLDLLKRFGRLYELEDFDNKKRAKMGLEELKTAEPEVDVILEKIEIGKSAG